MKVQKFSIKIASLLFIAIVGVASTAFAQEDKRPTLGSNYVECAGFIQVAKISTDSKLIGADEEKEKNIYSQGDYVYLNFGSSRGIKVGDRFSVVRPRGRVESRWSKKGNLGFYVQEVGVVEVTNVRSDFSIAEVKSSCDNLLLGDLVQQVPNRSAIHFDGRPNFDIFAEPSGKSTGKILMARDGQELITTRQVVYVDLGAEDNVKVGEYLTIFRPLGTGNIFDDLPTESLSARDEGFQSEEYRGGKFSNQTARKSGDEANGKVVSTKKAKRNRPANLRKVVGELVIINVKERTATAVVVRNSGEIHTGDDVEVQ